MTQKPIKYSRKFKKAFSARIQSKKKLRKQFVERVDLFNQGHRDQPINDHALAGKMKGLRSFSVSGDIRIIYRETAEFYEFLDVGSHAQVYGE